MRLCLRLAVLALPLSSVEAMAHEFWIEPETFQVAASDHLAWTLMVGHAADRQLSPIPNSRITSFGLIGPRGHARDLRVALPESASGGAGAATLDGIGTHMLFLGTDYGATSRLPARLFNAHAKREGLTLALRDRNVSERMSGDRVERYGRHAKAIVRSGADGSADPSWVTRPIGLKLEIVPELDPSSLPRHALLPVRILFEGRPLPGALVKLTDLDAHARPVARGRTDEEGRALFRVPHDGRWLVHVVWAKRANPDRDFDFETSFSSLSFQTGAGSQ